MHRSCSHRDARDTSAMPTRSSHLRRAVVLASVALGALSVPALAGAADRAADQQVADESVLTLADVPSGFDETTPDDSPDSPPGAACRAIRTAAKALDAAPHDEVQFETPGNDSGGALINNQVSVFATPKRAKAAYAPYAARSAKRCLETEYERIFLRQIDDPSAQVDVSAERFVPGDGDASTGYRVQIDASAQGDAETFYVEVEVVRVGRGIAAFGFFNTGSPPPSADVTDMTETCVARLESAL